MKKSHQTYKTADTPKRIEAPNRFKITIEGKTSSVLYPRTSEEGRNEMKSLKEIHTELQDTIDERHKVIFYSPKGDVLDWYDTARP